MSETVLMTHPTKPISDAHQIVDNAIYDGLNAEQAVVFRGMTRNEGEFRLTQLESVQGTTYKIGWRNHGTGDVHAITTTESLNEGNTKFNEVLENFSALVNGRGHTLAAPPKTFDIGRSFTSAPEQEPAPAMPEFNNGDIHVWRESKKSPGLRM